MPVDEALLHGPFYGNFFVRLAGALIFAFLFGSIPFGPLAAWLFAGLDERLGSLARGLVPVLSVFQGFIPVEIAAHGGGRLIGLGAALAVVVAHCYCPWLRFRGGGGAAVQLGALCALSWPAAVAFAVIWLAGALSSNHAAVGTFLATGTSFVWLWCFYGIDGAIYGFVVALFVVARNLGHFARLSEGTEPLMRRPKSLEPSVVRLERQSIQGV